MAVALLVLLGMPQQKANAEGELVWRYDGAPTNIHYSDVAVSGAGVYATHLVSWGEVAVQKRNADNSGGWYATFPIPTDSWFQGFPRIAADVSGVYVALSSAVPINARNGTLSLAKLSPVDGSIISLKNSNAPGYVNVTNVEVDSTGVYVAGGSSADRGFGGTSWRLEKWDKDLSGIAPIWGYSSKQSDGNAGDYWGPLGFAMNDQDVYLGGNRIDPGLGLTQPGIRIEKINKSTGIAGWVRLEPYGSGAIGVMALSDSDLYTAASPAYWGGFTSITQPSKFEKRPLSNGPASWSINTADMITALTVDGASGLYRAYVASGDAAARSHIDKVSLIDGSQLGTLTIDTGVYSKTKYVSGFGIDTPIVNNLAIDSGSVYIAGKDETLLGFGVTSPPRIERYNHFGSSPGSCGNVTDVDGNTYETIVIGSQCWMKQNMRVGTMRNITTMQSDDGQVEKYCYGNNLANCMTANHPNYPDGGLYTWSEAMQYSTTEGAQGICPVGWHVPTNAEWHTLEDYLKDVGQTCDPVRSWFDCVSAGSKLKFGGTSGFEGNLSGRAQVGPGIFDGRDAGSLFWTSSLSGLVSVPILAASESGVSRSALFLVAANATGYSVRCIQDSPAAPLLPAPTGLLTTPDVCGTGQINITWNSVAGASGYDLQIDGGAWLSLGNITSYTHSGLVAGSSHTYSVRAWDVNGPGTASAAVAQNAPSACPTCAAATVNNCILPNALDGVTVNGSCAATHIGACNFTCSSPNWNENSNTCVLIPNPPIITVTVTPTLVRSGERADIAVEVNDPVSDLSCTVLGVDPTGTPDSTTFDHEPSVTLDPITNKAYVTKPLTSAQLIRVSCTHTTLGITTSEEKRVNVSPSVQEI